MPWTIGAVCWAPASAAEPSLRTFSASAALIGAATLALTSDIAARSGSVSTSSASSSAAVTAPFAVVVVVMVRDSSRSAGRARNSADALGDGGGLDGVRVRDRVVARDVQRQRGVDRRRDVGVD